MPSSGPRDRLYSSRPTCAVVASCLSGNVGASACTSCPSLESPPTSRPLLCDHRRVSARTHTRTHASDDWRQSEEAGALPLSSAHTHTHNTVVVPNPGGGRPPAHPMHSHPESPAHPTSLSASDDEGRYASTAARRRLLLRPSISRGHAGVVALPPAAVCACASRRHSRVRNGAARLSSPHRAVAGS